jgi:1-deoxy-D-xylulose-5-phosphate reductoisomerase
VTDLCVLGSTGSVGRQTLAVVERFPERFRVAALAAGSRVDELAAQVERFRPALAAVADPAAASALRARLGPGSATQVLAGPEGLEAAASHPADVVVAAVVGAAGLHPTLAAVRAGRRVALANKEVLVMAGALVVREAARAGAEILPVDSEHSAIFQVLAGQRREDVARIVLTASGGPFRTWPAERIARASVEEALRHPNWSMGPKITVDSATLMNKGLEVIEARWLFEARPEQVAVVVHPESIVHSWIELVDGSVLAQLGLPDMRGPIALALSWPERLPLGLPRLDLPALGRLQFEEPDLARFPCLGLAFAALAGGEAAPAALNAANEVAVAAFLAGEAPFPAIPAVVGDVLDAFAARPGAAVSHLDDVLAVDAWARRAARERLAVRFGARAPATPEGAPAAAPGGRA